jgi:hypothetical protein
MGKLLRTIITWERKYAAVILAGTVWFFGGFPKIAIALPPRAWAGKVETR